MNTAEPYGNERTVQSENSDRRNLKAAVAAAIRDQVLTGRFRPGEKMNQEQLAEEFGTSRLPVREALIILETEGLVDNIARRGAFVAQLTREDIYDYYAVYGVVAGLAAARAAKRVTADNLAALNALIPGMEQEDEAARLNDLCVYFHRTINRAGSTRRLYSELRRLSEAFPPRLSHYPPQWRSQALREHQAILDALQAGDADTALAATAGHFSASGTLAVALLESKGFWAVTRGA